MAVFLFRNENPWVTWRASLSRVERALIGGAEIYTAGADPEWAEPG